MNRYDKRKAVYDLACAYGSKNTWRGWCRRLDWHKEWIISRLETRSELLNWRGMSELIGTRFVLGDPPRISEFTKLALGELIEDGRVLRIERPDLDDLYRLNHKEPPQ